MSFDLALILAVSVAAAPAPDPLVLLRRASEPPSRAYQLQATLTRHGRRPVVRRLRLSARPDGDVRRELSADGRLESLVVTAAGVDWLYLPGRRRAWKRPAADPFAKRLGPDEELDLLGENYDLSVSPGERVAGRSTWRVELKPRAPAAARRLWLDRELGFVLRSESLRPDGSPATSLVADSVSLAAPREADFSFSSPAGVTVIESSDLDYLDLDEARSASGLEPRAPAWLPPGYVLESVDVLRRGGKGLIHFRFTDGLSALSLFQAPPKVRLGLRGRDRRSLKIAGAQRALATWTEDGNVVAWSSRGQRFVLVGALPVETLKRTAESVGPAGAP